jgi:histone-lysine N-methyltransferase SETMAR
MLPVLEAAAENDWRYFATGDESWFFLQRAPKRMWTLERTDVLEKPRLTMQARKLMFTIMWSPQGFHVVDSIPGGTTMCSTYFTDVIFAQTAAAFFPAGRRKRSQTVTLHLDNCSIHRSRVTQDFMEQNGMESMLHPPYSPDLAPSDVFLFPLIIKRLDQFECDDPAGLFETVSEILLTIQTDDLRRVFQRWIDKVAVVAMGDGGYIPD